MLAFAGFPSAPRRAVLARADCSEALFAMEVSSCRLTSDVAAVSSPHHARFVAMSRAMARSKRADGSIFSMALDGAALGDDIVGGIPTAYQYRPMHRRCKRGAPPPTWARGVQEKR